MTIMNAAPEPETPRGLPSLLSLIVAETGTDRRVQVDPGQRLVVGSAEAADLRIPGMLGQHAVFHHDDHTWMISPFTNDHSRVNDKPMFGPHRLQPGDRVQLGTVTLTAVPVTT